MAKTIVRHISHVPGDAPLGMDISVENFGKHGRCAIVEENSHAAKPRSKSTARCTAAGLTRKSCAARLTEPSASAAALKIDVGTPTLSIIGCPNCLVGSRTMSLARPLGHHLAAISVSKSIPFKLGSITLCMTYWPRLKRSTSGRSSSSSPRASKSKVRPSVLKRDVANGWSCSISSRARTRALRTFCGLNPAAIKADAIRLCTRSRNPR